MHPTGSFHTRENNFDFLRFFAPLWCCSPTATRWSAVAKTNH